MYGPRELGRTHTVPEFLPKALQDLFKVTHKHELPKTTCGPIPKLEDTAPPYLHPPIPGAAPSERVVPIGESGPSSQSAWSPVFSPGYDEVDVRVFCEQNKIPLDKNGLPIDYRRVHQLLKDVNGTWDPKNITVVRLPKGHHYPTLRGKLPPSIIDKSLKCQDYDDLDDFSSDWDEIGPL
jgi:hypothetical protein